MSTHNIRFHGEIRKMSVFFRGQNMLCKQRIHETNLNGRLSLTLSVPNFRRHLSSAFLF